jgi:cell division protein FtsB
VARLILLMLAFVAFLFVFVFPIRTLLAQREERGRIQDKIDVLEEQSDTLEREAERLQNDSEVERLARERYNMVRPGETPYAVVPSPDESTTTTRTP